MCIPDSIDPFWNIDWAGHLIYWAESLDNIKVNLMLI